MKRNNVRITVSIKIETGSSYAENTISSNESMTIASYDDVDGITRQLEEQLDLVGDAIFMRLTNLKALDLANQEAIEDESKQPPLLSV